jgi:acyl-CoA thioester hydrolase
MRRMPGFPYVHAREVEFRDIDAAGHVNNAVYLGYVETARIGYLREALAVDSLDKLAVILASLNVDFRSPAFFGDRLEVGARVPRVGAKSFVMEHDIRTGAGRLVLEATSVLVAFDYATRETILVPEEWRRRIEAYEARSRVTA